MVLLSEHLEKTFLKEMKIMVYFRSHTNFKEVILFAVFSLFLFGAFILWARFDASRKEASRNMEFALRQCGALIQNGKKNEVSIIINNLLESKIFKHTGWGGLTWQAYEMSKSFREVMLPESAEMRKSSANVLLTGFLIWCVFFVAWIVLHLLQAPPHWQFNYLTMSIVVSVFFLFAALAGPPVDMGYRTNGIRFDLENLRSALALPEFPTKMLEQLQNPKQHGPHTYLLPYRIETKR